MATKTVSVLTGGTNNHTETAENINALGTDFISQGIVGAISATSGVAPTTGGFAVNAQGTPNMTVRVSNGVAYVTGTPTSGNSQLFRVSMSTYEDVTITANSSGSTKYDHIYIKLDATKLKDPAVDASDVATLVASRSTNASTDDGTPPTYGYKIAVVTVVNSATSIANASITDSRLQTGASSISTAAQAYRLGPVNYQTNNSTNTTKSNVVVQTGWGWVVGNGSSPITKAITFPLALDSIMSVTISGAGAKASSDPAALTDLVTGYGGDASGWEAYSITTAGFTAKLGAISGQSLSATNRYAFMWTAMGVKN